MRATTTTQTAEQTADDATDQLTLLADMVRSTAHRLPGPRVRAGGIANPAVREDAQLSERGTRMERGRIGESDTRRADRERSDAAEARRFRSDVGHPARRVVDPAGATGRDGGRVVKRGRPGGPVLRLVPPPREEPSLGRSPVDGGGAHVGSAENGGLRAVSTASRGRGRREGPPGKGDPSSARVRGAEALPGAEAVREAEGSSAEGAFRRSVAAEEAVDTAAGAVGRTDSADLLDRSRVIESVAQEPQSKAARDGRASAAQAAKRGRTSARAVRRGRGSKELSVEGGQGLTKRPVEGGQALRNRPVEGGRSLRKRPAGGGQGLGKRPVGGGGRFAKRPVEGGRGRRSARGVRGRAASVRRPVRLTRRGRVVLVFAVALLVLGALWVGTRAVSLASAQAAPSREGLPQVVVGQGDTLWTIADSLPDRGDAEAVVRRIMTLNGLTSSLIRPGTRLSVPPS
jgi:hypothetical protein